MARGTHSQQALGAPKRQGTHIISASFPSAQLERVGGLDISFVESPPATADDADL